MRFRHYEIDKRGNRVAVTVNADYVWYSESNQPNVGMRTLGHMEEDYMVRHSALVYDHAI